MQFIRAIFIVHMCLAAGLATAAEPQSDSSDFKALDMPAQVSLLIEKAVQHRDKLKNVSARGSIECVKYSYDPESGAVGTDILIQGYTTDFELKRIGDSYKIFIDSKPKKLKANTKYAATTVAYNESTNSVTQLDCWTSSSNRPEEYLASIYVGRDKAADNCSLFTYLGDDDDLDGGEHDMTSRFLRGVEDLRTLEVDSETGLVEATFPSSLPWGSPATCTNFFDPDRDFLLVKMQLTETPAGGDSPEKNCYSYTVEIVESKVVSGVHVPTKLKLAARCTERPNEITIHSTTVTEIAINELEEGDLALQFPIGTLVRDRIKRENFTVGMNGAKLEPTIPRADSIGTGDIPLDE